MHAFNKEITPCNVNSSKEDMKIYTIVIRLVINTIFFNKILSISFQIQFNYHKSEISILKFKLIKRIQYTNSVYILPLIAKKL